MTKVLGKDDLLSTQNLKRELVPVPQLDASIWMREMSADHVLQFKRIMDSFKADGVTETTLEQDLEIMTSVISFCACDENGILLFASPDEAKALVVNNHNVLMDLGTKALEISGVKATANGLTSEVIEDLPNDLSSSPSVLPRNSRKRSRKS